MIPVKNGMAPRGLNDEWAVVSDLEVDALREGRRLREEVQIP